MCAPLVRLGHYRYTRWQYQRTLANIRRARGVATNARQQRFIDCDYTAYFQGVNGVYINRQGGRGEIAIAIFDGVDKGIRAADIRISLVGIAAIRF